MYLTRFPLNMTRRDTRRMISSPYRMHAAICGCLPSDDSPTEVGRVLWRIDRRAGGGADLYMVSPQQPSLVGLDEQIGWPDLAPQWKTGNYDEFLERIAIGQAYQFRLVANPVVSRKETQTTGGRSKRMPHVTTLQVSSWLVGSDAYKEVDVEVPDFLRRQGESRAARNGFKVLTDPKSGFMRLSISDIRKDTIRKRSGGGESRLAFARYDGILEVVDAEKLRHALTHGIGHGKAFGCGLLTLSAFDG